MWLHVILDYLYKYQKEIPLNTESCRASFYVKAHYVFSEILDESRLLFATKEMNWDCEQYMHQEADEQISEWQSDAEVSRISITKRAPLLSYSVGIPQKFSFVWTPGMEENLQQ